MKAAELSQILDGCRELAIMMTPPTSLDQPRMHDDHAEVEVLTCMWNGAWPAPAVDPDDFYDMFHRDIAEVLTCAHAIHINPTIGLLVRGLRHLGVRGPHLETTVECMLECSPSTMRPDQAASIVRSLAWRRRLVRQLDRLRVVLTSSTATDAEIEGGLDKFVDMGAQQPASETAA